MTAGPEGECLRRATHDRARDRSRMAETPCGSVHESPVRGQRTRPTLKAVEPSMSVSLGTLARRMPAPIPGATRTVAAVWFDICHSDKGKTYCAFNVWRTTDLSE